MPHTDDILLCEACGYVLQGLDHDDANAITSPRCPECGTAVAWSLPTRRVGTPWQQSPTFSSWLITAWGTLTRPRALFDAMSTAPAARLPLLWSYLFLTAVLFVAPWAGMGAIRANVPPSGPHALRETVFYILGSLLNLAIALAVLWLLTWIEVVGIRFFAARRGWRLSRSAAWHVASHAAVGWLLCGLLPLLGMAILTAVDRLSPSLWSRTLDLRPISGPVFAARDVATVLLVAGGFFIGMVVFETLVYLGVRRCRWANAPRAT